MKKGAGEDPFADDDGASDEDGTTPADEVASQESASAEDSSGPDAVSAADIPYKYRRDGVQDGRDRVPLFLQPETKRTERDARREVERRFDDDVALTDLREAAVRVGLADLDAVESELETWGYGLTFEE